MTPDPRPRVRILTVCVGNICRSPVAERLLQQGFDTRLGPGVVEVASAGVRARDGDPISPQSAVELVRLGGDPAGFASRRLTPALVDGADLVIAMTRGIRTATLHEQPRAMKRVFTLGELAELCRRLPADGPTTLSDFTRWAVSRRQQVASLDVDVPDPIGRDDGVYRAVSETIHERCEVLLGALVPRV